MRVVLLNPPTLEEKERTPDIGLGYLASSLRKHNHEPLIMQFEQEPNIDRVVEQIIEKSPDLIGIKVFSRDANIASALVDRLLIDAPGIPIVLGGPHPSAVKPKIVWDQFGDRVHYIIKGEGEQSLPLLIEAIEQEAPHELLEKVPGLIWKPDSELVANPPYFEPDLDRVAIPAWDLIDPRNYSGSFFFWMNHETTAPVVTSRGCPFLCTFCSQNVITGKKVRQRGVDSVLDEIGMLMERYEVKHIDFIDDHFFLHKNFVGAIAQGLIDRNYGITWSAAGARLDGVTPEFIELVDRSGCVAMAVGLESGSNRVLKMIKKSLTVERARKHIDIVTKHSNIKIMGFFVLGFPTETEEEIQKTIDFAVSLPIHVATFLNFTPFPGSPLFDELQEQGWIADDYWLDVKVASRTYTAAGMVAPEVLDRLYRKAYRKFYLRPGKIASFVIDGFAGRQSFRPWIRRIMLRFSWRLTQRSFKKLNHKPNQVSKQLAEAAQ